jgi:hypothetical protein
VEPEMKEKLHEEENNRIKQACIQQYDYDEMKLINVKEENNCNKGTEVQVRRRPNSGHLLRGCAPGCRSIANMFRSRHKDYESVRYIDRTSCNSVNDLERIIHDRPLIGRYLKGLMVSLDKLVSAPFCYLAKKADPISLQLAVSYIENNEASNNIYVIHFVDDRQLIRDHLQLEQQSQPQQPEQQQQEGSKKFTEPQKPTPSQRAKGLVLELMMRNQPNNYSAASSSAGDHPTEHKEQNGTEKDIELVKEFSLQNALSSLPPEAQDLVHHVAILDSFYAFKKVHTIIVRGGFFCPSCLNFVAEYLNLRPNHMIIGVPSEDFPFPFSKLNGCRIAIPDADPTISDQTSSHLNTLLENIYQEHYEREQSSSSHAHDDAVKTLHNYEEDEKTRSTRRDSRSGSTHISDNTGADSSLQRLS